MLRRRGRGGAPHSTPQGQESGTCRGNRILRVICVICGSEPGGAEKSAEGGRPSRLLFVVDVLSPGATLPPLGSAEVEAFLTARGLDAERIVGGYGGIATRADLQAAANQR